MYGFSSCFLNDSIKPAQRESGSLPPCWVRSFTHRGVRIGAKNVRQRLRFTRALLESKNLFMWFCLPLYVWVSGHNPSSVETTPEQRSPSKTFSGFGLKEAEGLFSPVTGKEVRPLLTYIQLDSILGIEAEKEGGRGLPK